MDNRSLIHLSGERREIISVERVSLETRDRLEITDALYRFVAGSDFNREELFVSALTLDAIVAMTPGNIL